MNTPRVQFAWPPLTTGVKILLIVYAAVYLVHPMFSGTLGIETFIVETFYLSNAGMFGDLYLWQPVTYQLLHADFFHLLFNGMVLYFFGGDVEQRIHTRKFLIYAFICGLGSALVIILWGVLTSALFGHGVLDATRTVGASGAISGLVAAFSLFNWDKELRLLFAIAIKGKWLLPLFAGFDILMAFLGDNVSVAGHLGGMATGVLLTVVWFRPNQWLNRLRLWRLKRKLKVMRGGRGPTLKDDDDDDDKNGRTYH